jgi:DNA polymerase V
MKAIVDCNSFYCSCEQVFRPDLKGKPIVVLSNNDGCIISRNLEAKQLGIGQAGPFFKERPIIEEHKVSLFSSNYNLYGDMSRRVMEVLKYFVGEENVEVYSVDEAFLEIDDLPSPQLYALAKDILTATKEWTGIPTSIGIGSTKTLCKIANRLAKKNREATQGIVILDTQEAVIEALQQTPVGDIWGIGRRYADKLLTLGVETAWDVRNLTEAWARQHLGGVVGVRIVKELKGEPALFMQEALTKKKMIATTRMFGEAITQLSDLKEAVATYAGRTAEKLRRQRSAASVVTILLVPQEKIESPHFQYGPTLTNYTILSQPTSLTQDLIKAAVTLLTPLFQEGKKYKKAGVIVSGLVPDNAIQANLFDEGKSIGRFLMDMVDNINFSMRDDVVKFAASGVTRNWKMRQQQLSPRYTMRWDELCKVK